MMLQQKRIFLRKILKKNARHHVEACTQTFVVNSANHSKKIIFVVCKNMRNVLLSNVDIIIKIMNHRNYDKNMLFIMRQSKKNKKKIKFFNEKHNERIKCDNSQKKM